MKKVLFVLSMMLCVVLFSCSEKDDFVEVVKQEVKSDADRDSNKAWGDLRDAVYHLNNSGPYRPDFTRSRIGQFFTRLWGIIKRTVQADAEAALLTYEKTGTVECAIAGGALGSIIHIIEKEKADSVAPSRLAACANYSMTNNPLNTGIPTFAGATILADSTGYLHNYIIIDKYNANPAYFYSPSINTDSLLNSICGIFTAKKGGSQSSLYSTIHSNTFLNSMFSTINSNIDNVHSAISQLPGVDTNSLNFVYNYIESISQMTSNQLINTYTVSVLNQIQISEITDSEKLALKAGVLTAYASMALWTEYYIMVGEFDDL